MEGQTILEEVPRAFEVVPQVFVKSQQVLEDTSAVLEKVPNVLTRSECAWEASKGP